MGAAQSREEEPFIESGVRVTQGLLEQLEGKRRPRAAGGGSATALALRPPLQQQDADAAALASARQDAELARALDRSRRVGGMLLKAESEEMGAVSALAEELLASEYAAPARPKPCQQQAADCVACYAQHAGDPLACAPAVDAYSACAKAAWQEALRRGAV